MKKPLRIGIVGYGTGGQAASLLLARDGHRVEVFEQAPHLGPVGAGFLLQPTGLAFLWHVDCSTKPCVMAPASAACSAKHAKVAR